MKSRFIVILLTAILVFSATSVAVASHTERPGGKHYTLVDENNRIIHQTAMQVYEGDEYISNDNSRYKVVEIVGDMARCVYQGQEKMPELTFDSKKQAWVFPDEVVPVIGATRATVALYSTHSDESYVPTDGTESKEGNGGIYDVGDSFASALQEQGINVDYNKNNHNPHDINAYNRSRRTAVMLLKKKSPDAIVDVHRDAVPASQYQAQVQGRNVTKIKLVVGRENPNMKTNLEFAKRLKAVMDKQQPGLSNGIFMGKGDYNQDLSPRAMLIEVGTYTNSKENAKEGARLFASTMATSLGVNNPAKKPMTTDNQGAGTTILIILIVLGAAAGGFYFLNRGPTNK